MNLETKQSIFQERYPHLKLVQKPSKEPKQTKLVVQESFGQISGLKIRYTGETTEANKGFLFVFEWLEGPRRGTFAMTPIAPKGTKDESSN